jgi:hypothetical protein
VAHRLTVLEANCYLLAYAGKLAMHWLSIQKNLTSKNISPGRKKQNETSELLQNGTSECETIAGNAFNQPFLVFLLLPILYFCMTCHIYSIILNLLKVITPVLHPSVFASLSNVTSIDVDMSSTNLHHCSICSQ